MFQHVEPHSKRQEKGVSEPLYDLSGKSLIPTTGMGRRPGTYNPNMPWEMKAVAGGSAYGADWTQGTADPTQSYDPAGAANQMNMWGQAAQGAEAWSRGYREGFQAAYAATFGMSGQQTGYTASSYGAAAATTAQPQATHGVTATQQATYAAATTDTSKRWAPY